MYKPGKKVRKKKIRPYTVAISANGDVVDTLPGIKTFDDFSAAVQRLDIVHINNKITVLHK